MPESLGLASRCKKTKHLFRLRYFGVHVQVRHSDTVRAGGKQNARNEFRRSILSRFSIISTKQMHDCSRRRLEQRPGGVASNKRHRIPRFRSPRRTVDVHPIHYCSRHSAHASPSRFESLFISHASQRQRQQRSWSILHSQSRHRGLSDRFGRNVRQRETATRPTLIDAPRSNRTRPSL